MVIPSRNPWGIHHPHRQPARRKEKWEGGRANGGAKWEAIGGRQRENVCFCACLHACPPVFCVCAEIWGIYGSRVEMRRRVVCVCVRVWKRREDHFRAVRLLPRAAENKRQCLGAGGSAHGRRCNLGRFLAPAWISAAITHSHPNTHTQIQQNNCQTVLKLMKNYFGAAVLE